jgi:hypothetical protein
MLLAHVLVDSVGLTEKCEERCKQTGCPGEFIEPSYPSYPNQSYFARGYARLVSFLYFFSQKIILNNEFITY